MPQFDDNAGFGATVMYLTIQCTAPRVLFDSSNQVHSHGPMNHGHVSGSYGFVWDQTGSDGFVWVRNAAS